MKKLYFLPLVFLLFSGVANAQQDMLYSQYVFNTLAINPAYAGYKEALNVQLFSRLQWVGIEGAPKAYSAIVDGVMANRNIGWGGQFVTETIGATTMFSAYATYAYRLAVNDNEDRLTFGLSAGLSYQQVNRDKLRPHESDDDYWAYITNLNNEARPDFRFGIYYDMPVFFAGLSVTNLFANFSYAKRIPHVYLNVGGLVKLSEAVSLKPTFLLREDFIGPTNGDINLFAIFVDRVWVGAGYRTGIPTKGNLSSVDKLSVTNAVSFIAEVFATPLLRIGYSYDHHLNGLTPTHEISIAYTFQQGYQRSVTPRYF
jgi:type IX secretion system PorP/SprF family membrane protein